MKLIRFTILIAAILAASYSVKAAAEEQLAAYHGFGIAVDVSWLMNVKSAIINKVEADSPASRAGIAVGDEITEIEGCEIPGCGAFKSEKLMKKPIGEVLALKLRRQDGSEYIAKVVGEAWPE